MKVIVSILISVLLISGVFLFSSLTAAQEPNGGKEEGKEEKCVPGEVGISSSVSGPFRCDNFSVYKCANNVCGKAGGAMEQGIKWYMCETETTCWSDGCDSGCDSGTYRIGGPYGPEQIQPYGEVPDYQTCSPAYNNWSASPPVPGCSGFCYPPPNLKALNDNSLSPKNVPENSKYKLPMNFGWEDNIEKEVVKSPNFCKVGSYEFNIVEPPLSEIVTTTQLQKVEDFAYRLKCQLKSNTDYRWRARACLDSGGTDCGEWPNGQSFKTSLAPELTAPYDQDWAGLNMEGSTSTPVMLDWCDVKEANSFRLRVYIIEGGNKICHPNLLATKEGREFCDSLILRKTRRDVQQPERTLYSDFADEDLSFFTQDATFSWEVATCPDDSGIDCGDFSQQWILITQQKEFTKAFLVSPPNDPSGQSPVGLPLVLDWRKEAGINSWWYKIDSKQELAKTSQSRSFDYPDLSLNTFYRWQVLSCFDYEGKKCQDSWSEIYTFKTTGQPPDLVYPASGASNIPIPVNFDWDDVPGAKSYIISIQGDGLNIEKSVSESDFDIDFPEFPLKQETNYTWRVKTCARNNGQVCGDYSNSQSFRTFRILPPQKPSYPKDGGMLFTGEHFLSWEKVTGAKAYLYQIKYVSLAKEEGDQTCLTSVGKEIFPEPQKTLASSGSADLICLGEYQWQAKSCLDQDCKESSEWSRLWTFTFLEGGTGTGGLVPCGRTTNDDKTPWNEREPCQIKHLFLSVKIIMDFLLLRVMPIILVLLTIATAFIFYTAFGRALTMAQVISLWKAAGLGLGIIAFAWLIVNLFLGLVGYNISVFGKWYEF